MATISWYLSLEEKKKGKPFLKYMKIMFFLFVVSQCFDEISVL